MSVAEKEAISVQKRLDVNGVKGSRAVTTSNSEFGKKVAEDGRVFTAVEVGAHKTETDAWITVNGLVYAITRFIESHPGGKETNLEHLGNKDVGKVMRGYHSGTIASHAHSKYAFRMLQQFVIGRVSGYQRLHLFSVSLHCILYISHQADFKHIQDIDFKMGD